MSTAIIHDDIISTPINSEERVKEFCDDDLTLPGNTLSKCNAAQVKDHLVFLNNVEEPAIGIQNNEDPPEMSGMQNNLKRDCISSDNTDTLRNDTFLHRRIASDSVISSRRITFCSSSESIEICKEQQEIVSFGHPFNDGRPENCSLMQMRLDDDKETKAKDVERELFCTKKLEAGLTKVRNLAALLEKTVQSQNRHRRRPRSYSAQS